MADNFKHTAQKIELPEPARAAHRLSVPGGWLYSWGGGVAFVPVGTDTDIQELQATIDTLLRENQEAQASVKFLLGKTGTTPQPDVLQNALKEIRSKEGITLKEAQRIAGNALLEVRADES